MSLSKCFLLMSFLVVGIFSGCGKDEPQYIEVQAVDEIPVVQEDHTGHDHAMQEDVPVKYTLPAGWKAVATRSMQLVTLEAGEGPHLPANVSVSAFPGEVGGRVANINRWRGQVGLGPVGPDVAEGLITPVVISGMAGWQVDITGGAPSMDNHGAARLIVSAVFHNGQTWFFKLVGANSSVEPEIENYNAFVQSISF